MTLEHQKFSESDPVLIRQFSKNCSPIQSWICQNWPQSWFVLISAVHHWKASLHSRLNRSLDAGDHAFNHMEMTQWRALV